jgi:hypothetical protein
VDKIHKCHRPDNATALVFFVLSLPMPKHSGANREGRIQNSECQKQTRKHPDHRKRHEHNWDENYSVDYLCVPKTSSELMM